MSMTDERQTADVTTRLDRMESTEAIRRLVHSYAHAFDKRDLQRFMSLWTEDAVWSIGPGHEAQGRTAIKESTEDVWRDMAASHHWSSNSVIDVDGDTAVAATDVHAVAQGADGSWTQTAATYRDTYRRVDGTWLFEQRLTDIHRAWPIADSLS